MLFMLAEYIKEYPKRPLQTLNKFKNVHKYLHEMTVEEINSETKKWKPLAENTANKQKKEIRDYFRWLQTKGINVNPNIAADINIPTSTIMFLIYSSEDIAYYYDKLFNYLQKSSVINGTNFDKRSYLMSYAAGILAFYGLTEEQIINLDLSDVQPDRIIGYDLPLTDKDMTILLEYKNTTKLANKMPLIGTKYIRSPYLDAQNIDSAYLSRPIWRIKFDKDHEFLKSLLRVSNLYQLGIYNRTYQHEKQHNEILRNNATTPQWFIDMLTFKNVNSVCIAKKEYIEYRKERDNATTCNKPKELESTSTKSNEEIIHKRINDIAEQIKNLSSELQELQNLVSK